MFFDTVDGFQSGLDHNGLETESFHKLTCNGQVNLVIIDDHDSGRRRLEGDAVSRIIHIDAVVVGIVIRRSRIMYFLMQHEGECTSFTHLASYCNITTH